MALTYVVYGGVLFLSTFFLYLADKVKSRLQKKSLTALSFTVVFIVAAIRYNLGEDYPSYARLFYQFQQGSGLYIEPGYRYLNVFLHQIGFSFSGLVAFLSFITYLIFYKTYPKKKAHIFHFVFMCTLYLYSFSNFRSSIVYGLMFIATINYINNKNIFLFLTLLLISFVFHKSSVAYLAIPFLFTKPFKKFANMKLLPEMVLCVLLLLAFKTDVLREFLFFNFISESLGFSKYAMSEKWGGEANIGTGLGVLGALVAPTVFILFRHNLIKKDNKMIYVVILSFFYIFLIDVSLAAKIAARLKLLFAFINILIVYYLYFYSSKNNKVFIVLPVFLFFTLSFFKIIYDSDCLKYDCNADSASIKIAPYITIFNQEKSPRETTFID